VRYSRGTVAEPAKIDLRILQANERTLLSWIRTGLSLMAFGFVLARIGMWLELDGAHGDDATASFVAGVAFLVIGTLCHPIAALRFVRARRAIVEGREHVPSVRAAVGLAIAIMLLGAVLVVYLLAR
jgi:putative membrane protein